MLRDIHGQGIFRDAHGDAQLHRVSTVQPLRDHVQRRRIAQGASQTVSLRQTLADGAGCRVGTQMRYLRKELQIQVGLEAAQS